MNRYLSAVLVWSLVLLTHVSVSWADVISLQVEQDAHRLSDVQNGTFVSGLRLVNTGAQDYRNVLLVAPAANVVSAHPTPARQGANLVWNLGTLIAGDSAAVSLTLTGTAEGDVVVSPRATGTIGGLMHDAVGRTIALQGAAFPANLLASTNDVDPTDPALKHQAAALGNDPVRIFEWARDEVGHQFYTGALHGARGVIYGRRANRVDRASVLVGLLRAAGIPARYQAGTLDTAAKDRLAAGAMRSSGAQIGVNSSLADLRADPVLALELMDIRALFALGNSPTEQIAAVASMTDTELLEAVFAATRPAEIDRYVDDDHVWVEAWTGGNWTPMDPSFHDAAVGDEIGTAQQVYEGIPDAWRHKVIVSVQHEQKGTAFQPGLDLRPPTLVVTRGAGDLVGRPAIVTHITESVYQGGLIFVTSQVHYTPSVEFRDMERPDTSELIDGTTYTELASTFGSGLADTYVTAAWVKVELLAPGEIEGQGEVLWQNLADRIGYSGRNGGSVNIEIDTSKPALSHVDVTTLQIQASHSPARLTRAAQASLSATNAQVELINTANSLLAPMAAPTPDDIEIMKVLAGQVTTTFGLVHSSNMGERMDRLAELSRQLPYNQAPRVVSSLAHINPDTGDAQYGLDLMRERIESVPLPGAPVAEERIFKMAYGSAAGEAESAIISGAFGDEAVSTDTIVIAARDAGIGMQFLTAAMARALANSPDFPHSDEARLRIRAAADRGADIMVPEGPVLIDGEPRTAWFEIELDGNIVSRLDNGSGGALAYAGIASGILCSFFKIATGANCPGRDGIMTSIGALLGYSFGMVTFAVEAVAECAAGGQAVCAKLASPAWSAAVKEVQSDMIKSIATGGDPGRGCKIVAMGVKQVMKGGAGLVGESFKNASVQFPVKGVVTGYCAYANGFNAAQDRLQAALSDPLLPRTPLGSMSPVRGDLRERFFAVRNVTLPSNLPTIDVSGTLDATHGTIGGNAALSFESSTEQSMLLRKIEMATATLDVDGQSAGNGALVWDGVDNAIRVTSTSPYQLDGLFNLDLYAGLLASGLSGAATFGDPRTDAARFQTTITQASAEWSAQGTSLLQVGQGGITTLTAVDQPGASFAAQGDMTATGLFASSLGADSLSVNIASDAVVRLSETSGTLSIDTVDTPVQGSLSFAGGMGSVSVSSNSGVDTYTLDLTNTHQVTLALDTDTVQSFRPEQVGLNVNTSAGGPWLLRAQGPNGLALTWTDDTTLSIEPLPGLEPGAHVITVTAAGANGLLATDWVVYEYAPSATDLVELEVHEDPRFTAAPNGAREAAQVLAITHYGTGTATYSLAATVDHADLDVKLAANAITLRPGETGRIGFVVAPNGMWPAPGTHYGVTFNATGSTSGQLVWSRTIDTKSGWALSVDNERILLSPGEQTTLSVAAKNLGNLGSVPQIDVDSTPSLTTTFAPPSNTTLPGDTLTSLIEINAPALTPDTLPMTYRLTVSMQPTAVETERGVAPPSVEVEVLVVSDTSKALYQSQTDALDAQDFDLFSTLGYTSLAGETASNACDPDAVADLSGMLQSLRSQMASRGATAAVAALDAAIANLASGGCAEVDNALSSVGNALSEFSALPNLTSTLNGSAQVINGTTVSLSGTVVNTGNSDLDSAGIARLTIRRGLDAESEIASFPVGALASGDSASIDYQLDTTNLLGIYVITLTADADGVLGERDETDNTRIRVLEVVASNAEPNGNNPPTFTSTPSTVATIDTLFTYAPTTSDPDNDTVFVDAPVRPPGLRFENGELTGEPLRAGTFDVVLIASDRWGATASQEFQIQISDIPLTNEPPRVDTRPVRRLVVAQPWTYTAVATDPDGGDTATWAADQLPPGAIATPAGDSIALTWTPTLPDVGIHWIALTANDTRGGSTTHRFAVNVAATARGADLVVSTVDASGVTFTGRQVSGTADITIANMGDTASAATDLDIYEESDFVSTRTGTDTLLGQANVAALQPGEAVTVNTVVAGTMLFQDNIIHAWVDPLDVVTEDDETNNTRHTRTLDAQVSGTLIGSQDQASELILLSKDDTPFEVFDAATGLPVASGELQAMTPTAVAISVDNAGTIEPLFDTFVVKADGQIQAYLTHEILVADFGGDFFHQDITGNRVGREFVLFAPTQTVNNRTTVIAMSDASVTLKDAMGAPIQTLGLVRGQAWEPPVTAGVAYLLESTADINVQSVSVTGMSVVPPSDRALAGEGDVGEDFRFSIRARGADGGAIAVFAYEDVTFEVFREDGTQLTTGSVSADGFDFQTGLGNQAGLHLVATGPVIVLGGDMSRNGATTIDFMGEDMTQILGYQGRHTITHTLRNAGGNSVLLAGPAGAAVEIDGVPSSLAPFESVVLPDSQMTSIRASAPVITQIFGGGDRYFDQAEMLRAFPVIAPQPRVIIDGPTIDAQSCASDVVAGLRVGNGGSGPIAASAQVELVELTPTGESVIANQDLGSVLEPGMFADVSLTGPSQTQQGVARSWLIRITSGNDTLAWSAGPSGVVSTTCANLAPSFVSIPPTAVDQGAFLDYQATASDPEGDAMSFGLLAGPATATLTSDGRLLWLADDRQQATFAIVVEDTSGNAAVQSFDVLVGASGPCTGTDGDNDGFCVPADCDDTQGTVNPGTPEILGNGIDDDCNSLTPDAVSPAAVQFSVFTDNPTYGAFAEVDIRHRILNLSTVQPLGATTANTTVDCDGLMPNEFEVSVPMNPVGAGSGLTQSQAWQLDGTMLGSCLVTSALMAGNVELARSQNTFAIGSNLTGTLEVDNDSVLQGQDVVLSWSMTNPTDSDTQSVRDITAQGQVAGFDSGSILIAAGATETGDVVVETGNLEPGFYAVALRSNGALLAMTALSVNQDHVVEAMQVEVVESGALMAAQPDPIRYQPLGPVSGGLAEGGTVRAIWNPAGDLLIEVRTDDATQDDGDTIHISLAQDGVPVGDVTYNRADGVQAIEGTFEVEQQGDDLVAQWTLSMDDIVNPDDVSLQMLVTIRDGDGDRPRDAWLWANELTEDFDDIATFGTIKLVLPEDPGMNNQNNQNNANNVNNANNINNVNNANNTNGGTNNMPDPDRPVTEEDGCGCSSSKSGPEPGSLLLLLGLMGLVFGRRRRRLTLPLLVALGLAVSACGDDTTGSHNNTQNNNNKMLDMSGDATNDVSNGDGGTEVDQDSTDSGGDAGDAGTDAGGVIGDTCEGPEDCESGICLTGVDYNVCSRSCDVLDCGEGWTCEAFPGGGRACVPANICIDNDEDGYGFGRNCVALDCNDNNAAQNPGVTETCNGVDDNCDGEADEGLLNACGTCGALTSETCNGIDDDCDGNIDDGVLNACGTCGPVPTEVCNGLDDDCDGTPDDGVCGNRCTEGSSQPCYDGPPNTDTVGACAAGTQVCTGGVWGACEGQTLPDTETCDGIDNDCDADTDENLLNSCGACGADPREICNGIDDDCDNQIDEGVINHCGTCGPCGEGQIFPFEAGFGDPTIAPAPDGGITLGQGSVSRHALWIPNSDEDTISRWNTQSGREETRMWIGENPSRTSVDLRGNAWVAHRGDGLASHIYGTIADCEDRNNDGVIQTSRDLNGDGRITGGEMVNSETDPFADECLKCQVRLGNPTDYVRGVAVDADNNAWFGTWYSKEVIRVDDDCNVLNTIAVNQSVYGLVIDSRGHLFTSGFSNNCTVEIDTATATEVGRHCGPNGTRYGVAIDGNDELWFANYGTGIWHYVPSTDTWTEHVFSGTGTLSNTTGMVVGLDGSVFAAGYTSSTIGKFSPDTQTWESFSVRGSSTGLLDQANPRGVVIDAEGHLWGIARGSSGLIEMTTDGVPLQSKSIVRADNPAQGVGPYSYSDNTGFQLLNYTATEGTWRHVFDAGQLVRFRELTWTAYIPVGASVEVRVRASADQATLDQQTWTTYFVTSPLDLLPLVAADMRFLEMEFELASPSGNDRPVLRDIQVFFETSDCRDPLTPCPGGQICDTIQGGCIVVPTQCASDAACQSSEYCDVNGFCRAGCTDSPDNCPIATACNPVTRVCDPRPNECFTDGECPFDKYCENNLCEVGCRTAPDNCPVAFACNAQSHVCDALPPECAVDTECATGEFCDGLGRCAIGCRAADATTCAVDEICQAADHRCGPIPPTCDPMNPQPETCNGLDDNCDGTVDEGTDSGTTCAVGTSGATGNEVCWNGVVMCRANPSPDIDMPVILEGTMPNVLLPAGEYRLDTNAVASGTNLRIDDGAHVFTDEPTGYVFTTGTRTNADIGAATFEGVGIDLGYDSDSWFEGTTFFGSTNGLRGLSAASLSEVVLRNTTVTNYKMYVRNVFAEFNRFESNDNRARILLDVNAGGYVGDNQFVGANTVPRVQDGLEVTGVNTLVQQNRFEQLSTAIRVYGTAEIYNNTINNPAIGLDIRDLANVVSDANTVTLDDAAFAGTGARFFGYRATTGASITNTTMTGNGNDIGIVLDPDVFSTTQPADFTGTTITGIDTPNRFWLAGDGNGHTNVFSVTPLPGATDLYLSGNVYQTGGSLTVGADAPIKSAFPTVDRFIEVRSAATADFNNTSLEEVRIVTRGGATVTNVDFSQSRTSSSSMYWSNGGTTTISNSTFESTAPLTNTDTRAHYGARFDGTAVATISGSTFKSMRWGAGVQGTSQLTVQGSLFEDNDAGLAAQNNGQILDVVASSFVDNVASRVTYGILVYDTRAASYLNVTSANFDIGAEDIAISLTPNNFDDTNPSVLGTLTFANGEEGLGVALRDDQYVASATIQPLGTVDTFHLYDQHFDAAGTGNTMTIKSGVTITGNPARGQYVRAINGAVLTIEPGTLFQDVSVDGNDGDVTVDGATFQATTTRARNFVSAGNDGSFTGSNLTFIGAGTRNQRMAHVWTDGTVTLTDCDGTNLSNGVLAERGATAIISGGVWEDFTRFFDIRRNSDVTVSGVTMRDTDPARRIEGVYTTTIEDGLSINWSANTFDIDSNDIPFRMIPNTFRLPSTLNFSGTTFTNGEQGLGWVLRADTIWVPVVIVNLEPAQTAWGLDGTLYTRGTSDLSFGPGVTLYSSQANLRSIYFRDTSTANVDGVVSENIRYLIQHQSAVTVQNSTLDFSFTGGTYSVLPIDSTGVVTVQNNSIRATGAAVDSHRGFNIYGTAAVVPTLSNNALEGFNLCMLLEADPVPVLSGNTFLGCTTDTQQN